jgi:hypothetical protein
MLRENLVRLGGDRAEASDGFRRVQDESSGRKARAPPRRASALRQRGPPDRGRRPRGTGSRSGSRRDRFLVGRARSRRRSAPGEFRRFSMPARAPRGARRLRGSGGALPARPHRPGVGAASGFLPAPAVAAGGAQPTGGGGRAGREAGGDGSKRWWVRRREGRGGRRGERALTPGANLSAASAGARCSRVAQLSLRELELEQNLAQPEGDGSGNRDSRRSFRLYSSQSPARMGRSHESTGPAPRRRGPAMETGALGAMRRIITEAETPPSQQALPREGQDR